MNSNHTIQLQKFFCKNFRCFSDLTLDLDAPLLICEDVNGAGKTSLLEALYFCSHLKSFRTTNVNDLVKNETPNFFIKLSFIKKVSNDSIDHAVQVGFAQGEKLARLDQQDVASNRYIKQLYHAISITEDDLELIADGPEHRRTFIDEILSGQDNDFRSWSSLLSKLVTQRNSLFSNPSINKDVYLLLSNKIAEVSREIMRLRVALLNQLCAYINELLQDSGHDYKLETVYRPKYAFPVDYFLNISDSNEFMQKEIRIGRTLFGAHLDDFLVLLNGKDARKFASRGQQKLIAILFKIAYVYFMQKQKGAVVLLLDDFITDLDKKVSMYLVQKLIGTTSQLIFTLPANDAYLATHLRSIGARTIKLHAE